MQIMQKHKPKRAFRSTASVSFDPLAYRNNKKYLSLCERYFLFGAGGGGRTRTLSPGLDFESSTSANSITPAFRFSTTSARRFGCGAMCSDRQFPACSHIAPIIPQQLLKCQVLKSFLWAEFQKLFKLEFTCIKLIILAFFFNKFFVTTAFYNSSLFKNHNNVGIFYGRKPMRNNENSSVFHNLVHTYFFLTKSTFFCLRTQLYASMLLL